MKPHSRLRTRCTPDAGERRIVRKRRPSLVTSSPTTPTFLDETEAFPEESVGPHTPPADAMSPSTGIQCQQADMESYTRTTSQASAACSLLSPAQLTSSGLPTFDDMVSVSTRQSSDVTSSSMALQEQMFSGCGDGHFASNTAQMCPICLHTAFMNSGGCDPPFLYPALNCYCGWYAGCGSCVFKPVEHDISNGCYTESSQLQTGYTGGYLMNAAESAHDVPDKLLYQWAYGLDGQPIPQQGFVLENGGDWGVAGDGFGPTAVSAPASPGQITALDD
ncbi:hypothetical protein CNYM01_14135 [Colletotrichum nymphaeae SA-01]|uniref:Uncharacterized protein n=1 Tax=Colletotrichum nymphaeae SA-01 TaxID=1460502 RepID=A0A135UP29_9PEZI|nr:hypothetical protein CNYM01_14135 [Colletotrichum nymphaeae SA-01]